MARLRIACLALVAAAGTGVFGGTYRDAMGRRQGTATKDSYGRTTYRDAMGRSQGTATTDSYGKTTYRDAAGRVVGTKSK